MKTLLIAEYGEQGLSSATCASLTPAQQLQLLISVLVLGIGISDADYLAVETKT